MENIFLTNNKMNSVLEHLISELSNCNEYIMSVAFINDSGLTPLLEVLKQLDDKGVKGKILTTDYLNFTDPVALDKILLLKNVELKMYITNSGIGFHTKGYLFKKNGQYSVIIGSSNLTKSALTINKEWNTKFTLNEEDSFYNDLKNEFDIYWNSSYFYKDINEEYKKNYNLNKEYNKRESKPLLISEKNVKYLTPNELQKKVIENTISLINNGKNKGLLISATGTGKTYAAAFTTMSINPEKMLFICHREQIVKQAMESFKNVIPNKKYGLLSANYKDFDSGYIFSTMTMLSKDEILNKFDKNYFELIIIDEVHKAGANSYVKILNHFNPKFLFGMTATPERTDKFDIYNLFDHNIIYDIRLKQAIENDLLSTFHYFAITEMNINGKIIDDSKLISNNFLSSTIESRVKYIIEKSNYYGYPKNKIHGLIFCRNIYEGKLLEQTFNNNGYKTKFLSGIDSVEIREKIIEKLVKDKDNDDYLDYIITVDIFNEGVDIPEINQVILLRPTESPIVFIQQIGRGLRKIANKEYVVIMDFIGNYSNNYMIAVALSGDNTYNKDNIRRFVHNESNILNGSTINFDLISKRKLYESIDTAKINQLSFFKSHYLNLKQKIGRIPKLNEFNELESIDVINLFKIPNCDSYQDFLIKIKDKDYKSTLNNEHLTILKFITKKLAFGKRIHELEMLKLLENEDENLLYKLENIILKKYGFQISKNEINTTINILTNEFFYNKIEKPKYDICKFIEKNNNDYKITKEYKKLLENYEFREAVSELLDFGIKRYKIKYSKRYKNTNLCINEQYSREDVCKLLNWNKNINGQNIGGYKYDELTKTMPVFINYHKSEEDIDYEDKFINEKKLIALSKNNRNENSKDSKIIYKRNGYKDAKIYLFVKKNKQNKDIDDYYFLGEINAQGSPIVDYKKNRFKIEYNLENQISKELFSYIVGD
ncbi:DEAD/DEAH box helicase [Oceanivirga salmonicida]|uniref:DEAD/DEAH box helicase n=1 Tax=Oceanivirga salmonicida TaxID=1769291 RepID=UPI0012E2A3EC|nr:DEAD/DEAH box helicase [Oceanivirga salmonicida]